MDRRLLVVAGIWALTALWPARGAEGAPPEPDDYRTDNYRAPTPSSLRGARVVTTAEAAALWRSREAAFIDVLPRPPRPPNLPEGTLWRDKPRLDIPNSVWLPDTGYGALAPATERYFRAGLIKASGGDRAKALVVYCLRDCWMSWNAARRALAIGYENVIWYPDGTDGWASAGLPLEQATPEPQSPE
ncbi:MAG: PQQ-dependent catabolism-associated CXXCW motif protein [Alphaproteobacteria bacterium]|nr:PQQ-dependent catabolism-associated CXXCW motif protein [Alphaproteobacteria bacterium]